MSQDSFTDDDGFTYIAINSFGSCDDCHFADQSCVMNSHSCIGEFRDDKQDIYWKQLTKESK